MATMAVAEYSCQSDNARGDGRRRCHLIMSSILLATLIAKQPWAAGSIKRLNVITSTSPLLAIRETVCPRFAVLRCGCAGWSYLA